MSTIIEKIHRKLGTGPALTELAEKLSLSELNTFLLELFRLKTRQVPPPNCCGNLVRTASSPRQ